MSESAQSDWPVADLHPDELTLQVPELKDETEIIRYVRLSTLFLYLSDRAFIPSLETLRGMDRFEGMGGAVMNVPTVFRAYDFLLKPFVDFLYRPQDLPPDAPAALLDYAVLYWRWTEELAKRRAVWCWNLFEGESNAMWAFVRLKRSGYQKAPWGTSRRP